VSAFSSIVNSNGFNYFSSSSSFPSTALELSSGSYLSTPLLHSLPTGSSAFSVSSWVKCDASSLTNSNPFSVVISWGESQASTSTTLIAATMAVTSKERATFNVIVSTIAGVGVGGNDEGTSAKFNEPCGVAVHSSGNIYIADYNNHKIRKVSPDGVVSTLAGKGTPGSTDEIGPLASFNIPYGIFVTETTEIVYVADYGNNRIRRVTSSGAVETIAGGSEGYADGPGNVAQFRRPAGVVVDLSGKVFVADLLNNRIRIITPNGQSWSVSTLTTQPVMSLNAPTGIAIDAIGNLFIADQVNNRICKITPTGTVTYLGEGNSRLNHPTGVVIDSSGNAIVADMFNHRIVSISPSDVITIVSTGFNGPTGIDIDAFGNVFVADRHNHRIRKISFFLPLFPVCDSIWHHLTLTYSGSSDRNILSSYIDGTNIASSVSTFVISSSASSALRIGWNGITQSSTSGELFSGSLSDIRIFNRALSETEVNFLKNLPPSPSATTSATSSSSPSSLVTISATTSQSTSSSSSLSVSASPSSMTSPSSTGSPSTTLSSLLSPSSHVTVSSTSSATSSPSAFPSIPSTSAFPSKSAVPTISSIASLTSSSTSSSTATSSRTSTSTLRAPDLQSPSPSPQPIVNVALSLKNVQLSLFTNNDQLTTTLLSLATAASSAAGVAPSFVSTRRISDVTFPLTPSVIWTNPDFAGDVFLQRRLQGGPSSIGSVSIDIQIKVLTTASASTLSSTLASSTSKLATDISQSLLNQGSPLSTATFSVSVEPFTGSSGNVGVLTAGNTSPPLTQSLLEIALPSFVTGALFSAFICVTCYFFKRRSSSAIAPEEEDTQISQSNNWSVSVDRAESKHSQQQQKSRNEPNTDEPDLIVAKIGADHETSKTIVGDKMEALKAQQEAATQERIAQREALKARVARKKADEYKKLVQQQ
jgi:sugar lactone lactonase YvrE